MKGIQRVIVSNKRVKYQFELCRNLTVIRGDSATGKTTLIEMIGEFYENGAASAVNIICAKECYVLSGRKWLSDLQTVRDSIVFIDEGNEFVFSNEFAAAIKDTDNYYVIVTREAIPALPYSVDEVYGIRESGKYGTLKQTYNEFYRFYAMPERGLPVKPECVITEDSNAGNQFFSAICDKNNIRCIGAGGKSNIFHQVSQVLGMTEGPIVVIADGAAFGAEMERLVNLARLWENIVLYLPESFEWLILHSGVVSDKEIAEVLSDTSNYVESSEYFSWERFFTALLIKKTDGSYLQYAKRRLNTSYCADKIAGQILQDIGWIEFG